MLNVLAIGNWSQEHIYSYHAFPQYKRIERRIAEVQRFLEPQLKNMAGHPFVTLSDNIMPRSIIYKDANGTRQLAGYLLPFMRNFVRRLNATFTVWWEGDLKDGEILNGWKMKRLINMGKVNAPMSISEFPSPTSSYVVEMSKCQLMLPTEPEVSTSLVMIDAANPMHFILVSIAMLLFGLLLYNAQRLELGLSPGLMCLGICIDSVLRAMICQTFVLRRTPSLRLMWIYFLLFICSFLSYNIYIAQLQMLLVQPLREPLVRTYEDMRRTGLKILLTEIDKNAMSDAFGKETLEKNWDVHRLVDSATYQALRSLPNISYAYPVTQTLWPLIKRKFAKQSRVSFRLSQEFEYISLMPYAIPLSRNSIYRLPLNRYILDTQSSGLYKLWRYRVFDKLVAIRQFTELPYEGSYCNTLLQSKYSSYYVYAYFCAIAVCLLVFVIEIVVYALL
ncbi:GH21005 [Drosophila grimshawi]|uniref:GH21005 n=2 Tax=Drosophila grimshawi TaxID=7222 RepID=B4J539_DROGR|nr:GH21005 [Drosophila grimshawi]